MVDYGFEEVESSLLKRRHCTIVPSSYVASSLQEDKVDLEYSFVDGQISKCSALEKERLFAFIAVTLDDRQ